MSDYQLVIQMPEKMKSAFIVDDNEAARATLVDSLGEGLEFVQFASVEEVYEQLIGGHHPDLAFVDIHLRTDSTAGFRVLELLRGLSPETVICIVSTDLGRIDLMKHLSSWPSLGGVFQKGELSICIPEFLHKFGNISAKDEGGPDPLPFQTITIGDEVGTMAGVSKCDIEAMVKAVFPFDSHIDVVLASRGMSGAIGFSVVVRSSVWRSETTFYFLKICRSDGPVLEDELENYRQLRESAPDRTFFPKCYGILRTNDLTILIYEYIGVAPRADIDWEPIHFDKIFQKVLEEGGLESMSVRKGLRRAFEPLGNLIRSTSCNPGKWITDTNRRDLDALCRKAAISLLRRLGKAETETEMERISMVKFLCAEEIEEIRLVDANRDRIFNPLWRLRWTELDTEASALNLGTIHGDLHCNNLICAQESKGLRWMLIDFEHVRPGDLQMLDAARLECDLLFERTPIWPLEASYRLARHVNGLDIAGSLMPEEKAVADTVALLRDYVSVIFDERWRQREVILMDRQYLYALLYESVRWLTHRAGPVRFLQRLFYGSVICEALDQMNRVRGGVH